MTRRSWTALPASLGSAKSYILEVTGGTDSVGSAQYNYDLSQRRADAVVQYLAAKYNIAPHRFYLIGIGKDQYVASITKRQTGRKENRRVQVQLLSNMSAARSAARDVHAAGASIGPGYASYRPGIELSIRSSADEG